MDNTMLNVTYADAHLGVRGEDFEILFSYQHGGPVSLVKNGKEGTLPGSSEVAQSRDGLPRGRLGGGKEWLYRAPRPAFWRALTDNDRGNGFHLRSGMWLAADTFIALRSIAVKIDGAEAIAPPVAPENNRYSDKEAANEVKITYVFETITVPSTEVAVSYTVSSDGKIAVDVHYTGKEGLPELPVFGLRFVLPTLAVRYRYEGLSGETYPDRMAGGIRGIYEVTDLSPAKYLTVQECGMHMETERVEIFRNSVLNNADHDGPEKEFSLTFEKAGNPFAFTCLPYTPEEMESALHIEELPPARRTVLTVYGAVRGVGGIDSWGADVSEAYHIDAARDIDFSFVIN